MRKALVVALCGLLLSGCGSNSDLYSSEIAEVTVSHVSFDIPKVWNDYSKKVEDYDYYYSGDVIFNVEVENVEFTNDELISEKETWISSFLEDESFKESNIEIVDLEKTQALECV